MAWVANYADEYKIKSVLFPVTQFRKIKGERRIKENYKIDKQYLLQVQDNSNRIFWASIRFIKKKDSPLAARISNEVSDETSNVSFIRFTGQKEKMKLEDYFSYIDDPIDDPEELLKIIQSFQSVSSYVRLNV